jgi:hypothetical protein
MRLTRLLVLSALVLVTASPAYADATYIMGWNRTVGNQRVRGFSIGAGAMIAAEFEYANSSEDVEEGAPGLRTFMGNVLIQSPVPVAGFQPYITGGGGWYKEKVQEFEETAFAFNGGVGVKIKIWGPIRTRIDTRWFKLKGDPVFATHRRFYAGINLQF